MQYLKYAASRALEGLKELSVPENGGSTHTDALFGALHVLNWVRADVVEVRKHVSFILILVNLFS